MGQLHYTTRPTPLQSHFSYYPARFILAIQVHDGAQRVFQGHGIGHGEQSADGPDDIQPTRNLVPVYRRRCIFAMLMSRSRNRFSDLRNMA